MALTAPDAILLAAASNRRYCNREPPMTNGRVSKDRKSIIPIVLPAFAASLRSKRLPTRIIPYETRVYRYINPSPGRRLDYNKLFRQRPGGSTADAARWSGPKDGATPGVSGSYWGSLHGMAAECFFYSTLDGYDPKAGPLRLLPPMTPLFVGEARSRTSYLAGEDDPKQIPFSANYNTDIIIAKLMRDLEVADMDVTSEAFQEFNYRLSREMRAELDLLEFTDFSDAIGDPDFRDLARLVGNEAYAKKLKGLVAKSARAGVYKASAYDPKKADIVVILGEESESFSPIVFGQAIIEVRTDENGPTAKICPIPEDPNPSERALALLKKTPDAALWTLRGPSGAILASNTMPDEGVADKSSDQPGQQTV